jgi:membrane protein required for colicin V production
MNIVDIILLICFIPALIQGFRKGFISQIIAIVSIIAGAWVSFRFAGVLGQWLCQYINSPEQVLTVAAFALIFIAAAVVMALLGKLLEKVIKLVMLEWLNKVLGVVFSLGTSALAIGLIIMIFCSLNNTYGIVGEEILNDSVLFTPLKNISYTIFPYLKELLFWNK